MIDKQTIDTYNKMAKEYDEETINFWNFFPRTFLDTFIAESGPRILDVGSGPGRDGLLLKNTGKEVVCVDASAVMIELSRQRGLESIQADFHHLPFEDCSFDGVWAYTSLLHTPKDSVVDALQEIHRVLKTGSVFALGLIEGEGEVYKESAGVNMPRLFSLYQKDEVEKLSSMLGFTNIHFDSFKPRSSRYLHFLFRKL